MSAPKLSRHERREQASAAWAEKAARLRAFLAEQHLYETCPAYRASIDAVRAKRQAAVYAKMDEGIARFRAERAAA